MHTDRLDLDEELFEDGLKTKAPSPFPNSGLEAMVPARPAQPLLDRFEPRYRPVESHSHAHPTALMVAALLLVALVAVAGWYFGDQSATDGQASQVVQAEKQNKAQ